MLTVVRAKPRYEGYKVQKIYSFFAIMPVPRQYFFGIKTSCDKKCFENLDKQITKFRENLLHRI